VRGESAKNSDEWQVASDEIAGEHLCSLQETPTSNVSRHAS
jgi:hypothetical protein